jgi:hypothetical protein
MQKIQRNWLPWTVATVAAAGLALSIGTRTVAAHDYERNPAVHHAIDALYEAHDEIDHSHHLYHDHKREALDAIDHAIDRLEFIKDFED